MLPARTLRLLLLRLRLPLLFTEARFFRVPLREGVPAGVPWPRGDARGAERAGEAVSSSSEVPRVRAWESMTALARKIPPPRRSLSWRPSDCESGDESVGFAGVAAKSLLSTLRCEPGPYPRLRWAGSLGVGTPL